ncbi:MAG TPA: hypothetical protein VHT53_13995 [Candidatus Elarobacter sp.]|nr:hypothetical protein [Candidatus Elarobacter sp.]
MGREARCAATWGAHSGDVTVHLDGTEIAVRGAFRARAPLASLRDVRVAGDTVRFRAGDDDVALALGRGATRWASALTTPPPTLAAKLGIGAGTRVAVEGAIDDDALAEALAAGLRARAGSPDIIVARTDDAAELERIVVARRAALARRVPIWVVYTKGRRAPLGESAIRDMLRARGLVDLKVAAVSPVLTALQFVARRTA